MIELHKFPHVKIILSDADKTICSVRIAVERTEKIDSGSMMFHHPRYITFGQTVVFCNTEVIGDQCGALIFQVSGGEEAAQIIENIQEYIPFGKETPEESIIIEQKI